MGLLRFQRDRRMGRRCPALGQYDSTHRTHIHCIGHWFDDQVIPESDFERLLSVVNAASDRQARASYMDNAHAALFLYDLAKAKEREDNKAKSADEIVQDLKGPYIPDQHRAKMPRTSRGPD